MEKRKTAGELSAEALSDTTTYQAMEVARASIDGLSEELFKAAHNYQDRIAEEEYCVIMVIATDPLISNLKRRKFYCWPWLPSPRPNQSVFLYNKTLDKFTKRLWVLPCAATMAELSTPGLIVDPQYQNMKRWSENFFKGTFWEEIRKEHEISLLSQQEYFYLHREELKPTEGVESLFDDGDLGGAESFDFSKIGNS